MNATQSACANKECDQIARISAIWQSIAFLKCIILGHQFGELWQNISSSSN
jgi:hypothetical protein